MQIHALEGEAAALHSDVGNQKLQAESKAAAAAVLLERMTAVESDNHGLGQQV